MVTIASETKTFRMYFHYNGVRNENVSDPFEARNGPETFLPETNVPETLPKFTKGFS